MATNLSIDPLVLPTLQPALKAGKYKATVSIWNDREVLRIQPGYAEGVYLYAVLRTVRPEVMVETGVANGFSSTRPPAGGSSPSDFSLATSRARIPSGTE